MSAKPPSLPSAEGRRFRVGHIVFGASASLFLFLLVWHVSFRVRINNELRRLEATARANGEPWTPADVAAAFYAPIPDQQNAAIPLMELWAENDPELMEAYRSGTGPVPKREPRAVPKNLPVFSADWKPASIAGPLTADELALAKRFLKGETRHLERLHQALLRSSARFPFHIETRGPRSVLHLELIRNEMNLLKLHCFVHAADGDTHGAAQACHALFRLSRLLDDDPWPLGHLTRLASLTGAIDCLEVLVRAGDLPEADGAVLKEELDREPGMSFLRKALITERAENQGWFEDPEAVWTAMQFGSDGVGEDAEVMPQLYRFAGLLKADLAFYLATMERAISNTTLNFPDALGAADRLEQDSNRAVERFPKKYLSRLLRPGFRDYVARHARFEARRRTARAVLAIEDYRRIHGAQPPDSLAGLVPAFLESVPDDPFDGQPLRYRRLTEGYVVYSVGEDRVDDGGRKKDRSKSKDKGTGTFDEAFVVER